MNFFYRGTLQPFTSVNGDCPINCQTTIESVPAKPHVLQRMEYSLHLVFLHIHKRIGDIGYM